MGFIVERERERLSVDLGNEGLGMGFAQPLSSLVGGFFGMMTKWDLHCN